MQQKQRLGFLVLAALLMDNHWTCLLIVQLCDVLVLLEHHLQCQQYMVDTSSTWSTQRCKQELDFGAGHAS